MGGETTCSAISVQHRLWLLTANPGPTAPHTPGTLSEMTVMFPHCAGAAHHLSEPLSCLALARSKTATTWDLVGVDILVS